MQALTTLGEPRIVVHVPGAGSLGGLCSDGSHVFVTDADKHRVHVLQLRHESRKDERRRLRAEDAEVGRPVDAALRSPTPPSLLAPPSLPLPSPRTRARAPEAAPCI